MSSTAGSEWKQSVGIPSDVARKTGCFTTLPIRIHQRNDIADDTTLQSISDWRQHVGDGWEAKSGSAISIVGNWCSFIFPESLPDRLASITYLANIGNIHDDATEDVSLDAAIAEHKQLSAALSVAEEPDMSAQESKTRSFRHLVSNCVLNILSIDRDMGMRMIVSYQQKWLDVMEHLNYEEIESLDEYLNFRMLNGGMEPFWLMCQFGMGLNISVEELAPTRHIFEQAERALVLTNDYWSWGREHNASVTKGSRLVNSIELISRLRNISYDEAKCHVRDLIVAHEKEYEKLKDIFFRENPSIPAYLRQFVEMCGLVVAGNHYWCANCPRHHAWEEQIVDATNKVADSKEQEGDTKEQEEDYKEQEEDYKEQEEDYKEQEENAAGQVAVHVEQQHDLSPTAAFPEDNLSSSSDLPNLASSDVSGSSCTSGRLQEPIEVDGKTKSPTLLALTKPHPVDAVCDYVASTPSKGVRSTIIHALNQWFHVSNQQVNLIKDITAKLHNSSLILDDIQDESPLRRDRPSAHTIFGTAQSINSSTYLFVQAMQLVNAYFEPHVQASLLEILHRMHIGQSYDLDWKFHLHCPTEPEYLHMVDQKTGAMFELLLLLLASKSQCVAPTSFSGFVKSFGRYFQVRDDYMNLTSVEYAQGKGACEDLDEGKLSYPLVVCKRMAPASFAQIIGIFRTKKAGGVQLSGETKTYISELLRSSGALDATVEVMIEMERRLEEEVRRLEEWMGDANPMLHVLLQTLSVRTSVAGK